MPFSNTTFFLIPGAFCPGYFYHKVVSLLEARGYHAHALDLPTMDPVLKDEGKPPGMYDDATYVREKVSKSLDEGHNVILVGSSYGSAVTLEACKFNTVVERKAIKKDNSSGGELKHLILLGGLLAEAGPTVKEVVGGSTPNEADSMEAHIPATATHLPPIDPTIAGAILCGALPKEEQDHYIAMCKPISIGAFNDPLTFTAWEGVPTTLIIGDQDLALAPEKQHEFFDKAVRNGVPNLKKVVLEGGDHLPMLSDPEAVVKVCVEAAGDV